MTTEIIEENIFIGKDILELLSSSMYVNPLTIYREYLQNTMDSLEVSEINPKDYRVDLSIDRGSRKVSIKDNGDGIPSGLFLKRMLSLGDSSKRGTEQRGFRGVGRLSGLGYCRQLKFISTHKNEKIELKWDCIKLRQLLKDISKKSHLSEVIKDCVSWESSKVKEVNSFEVELNGVVRLSRDLLVNIPLIKDYLSCVAPVPFSPEFEKADILHDILKDVKLGNLKIYLNDEEDTIYRPHNQRIQVSEQIEDYITEIEPIEIKSQAGSNIAAVGWIMHTQYKGAIQRSSLVRGLRTRVGNIQVGEENILEDIFVEKRFNSWSIGEIHILDSRIIPNGRRDNFEENVHFENLKNDLLITGRSISKKCRDLSSERNWVKKFDVLSDKLQSNLDLLDFQKIEDPNDSRLKNLNNDFESLEKISENPVFDKIQNQSKKEDLKAIRKAFRKIVKSAQLEEQKDLSEENSLKSDKELPILNFEEIKSKHKDVFETIIQISEDDQRFSFLDSRRTKLLLNEICERLRT